MKAIKLTEKLASFTDRWSPKIVGQLNDYHLKLVKIKGEFVWHSHADTDELFMVLSGDMLIDFRDKAIRLSEGDVLVVPCGIEHKPRAEEECHLLLIEPAGTVNTGDAGGDFTNDIEEWI